MRVGAVAAAGKKLGRMMALRREWRRTWPIRLIFLARALTVGISFWLVQGIPGLTSSFVAIFSALIPFDILVAMPKWILGGREWRAMWTSLRPRVWATAFTLGIGLGIGILLGLTVHGGLPSAWGAILTVGLAYMLTIGIPGNISTYVAMLGGVAVYTQVSQVEYLSGSLILATAPVAWQSASTTFIALGIGWAVGLPTGFVTRLALPRGYRTRTSSAYDTPLEWQPLRDVLHSGADATVIKVRVEEGAALDGILLSQSSLRERYGFYLLVIERAGDFIPVPVGAERLRAGDVLFLMGPTNQIAAVDELVRGETAADHPLSN